MLIKVHILVFISVINSYYKKWTIYKHYDAMNFGKRTLDIA